MRGLCGFTWRVVVGGVTPGTGLPVKLEGYADVVSGSSVRIGVRTCTNSLLLQNPHVDEVIHLIPRVSPLFV